MRLAVEARDIHPAEPVPTIWLTAGLALVVAAVVIALLVWFVLRRSARAEPAAPNALEALRHAHLDRIDGIIEEYERGQLAPAEAVVACSGEARAFVGVATHSDVDFATLHEIEAAGATEPRLRELADLVRRSYPVSFAGADDDSVAEVLEAFRQVTRQWR